MKAPAIDVLDIGGSMAMPRRRELQRFPSARPLFALEHDTTEKLDGMPIRITLRRAPGSSKGASEGAPPVV